VYIAFIEESESGKRTKSYQFGSEEFSLSGYPDKDIVFTAPKYRPAPGARS